MERSILARTTQKRGHAEIGYFTRVPRAPRTQDSAKFQFTFQFATPGFAQLNIAGKVADGEQQIYANFGGLCDFSRQMLDCRPERNFAGFTSE
jgi:hypothetical protein